MLRAGRLSASLGPDGAVRALRVDGGPSLVGIGFLVRDRGWGTVPGEVERATTGEASAWFAGRHRGPGVDLAWEVTVDLSEAGLAYRVAGHAVADSSVNRVGLVALHPASWAGLETVVSHPDGSSQATRFPELVSPWQPFLDVAALTVATPGGPVNVRFDGDVFETEDQRNWSDASFKTYSRPLALPFPYTMAAGERFEQAVTVEATSSFRAPRARTRPVTVEPGRIVAPPEVGLVVGPDEDLRSFAADLADISPAWLRADVVVGRDGLAGGDRLAQVVAHGLPVAVAVHVAGGGGRGMAELAGAFGALPVAPAAGYAFDAEREATTPAVASAVRATIGPGVPLFVGTDGNLAELNRNRVDPAEVGADGVVFAATPTVHDDDAGAIAVTSDALPAMVATVRSFACGALEVGPLTLRPRRTIHTADPVDRLRRDAGSIDPRQHAPLAAAWLLASLAALAAAGVERVTLGELSGLRGLVPAPGLRSPAAEVVRAVCRATIAREVVTSDDAIRGLELDGALWLANRTAEPVEVRMPSGVVTVGPYAVAVTR